MRWYDMRNVAPLCKCVDMVATWSTSANSIQNMESLQENAKSIELTYLLENFYDLSQCSQFILFYFIYLKKDVCDRGQDTT